MSITLDEVQSLIAQLSPEDKRHLWNQLSVQLAQLPSPPVSPPLTHAQARAALVDLRATISAVPQPRRTIGEQLEHDRAARQASIEGTAHDHP